MCLSLSSCDITISQRVRPSRGMTASRARCRRSGAMEGGGRRTGLGTELNRSVAEPVIESRNSLEKLEAPPGFEPGMEVLQTSALPLGDGAGWTRIGQGNPAAC